MDWSPIMAMAPGLAQAHPAFCLCPGALAWNADQLSSGSRDRMILQRDIRTPPLQSERRLQGHRQEVCGLKWSTDHQLLASGGNDNKVWLGTVVGCVPLHSSGGRGAQCSRAGWLCFSRPPGLGPAAQAVPLSKAECQGCDLNPQGRGLDHGRVWGGYRPIFSGVQPSLPGAGAAFGVLCVWVSQLLPCSCWSGTIQA